jgi:hypothetical protein
MSLLNLGPMMNKPITPTNATNRSVDQPRFAMRRVLLVAAGAVFQASCSCDGGRYVDIALALGAARVMLPILDALRTLQTKAAA